MLETGLNTKQLHYCDKFNKITPSGKSSTGGGVKTRYYGIIFFALSFRIIIYQIELYFDLTII